MAKTGVPLFLPSTMSSNLVVSLYWYEATLFFILSVTVMVMGSEKVGP